VSIFSFNSEQSKIKMEQLKLKKLVEMPRFTSGNIKILNWDLDFLDGPALWSCIDVLVDKKWNDFIADHDRPVILDCGANIGVSVLNYKRQFPLAKIIAFEPDPNIVSTLKRNLHKNGADDVTVIDSAVWTRHGEISFYCEGADGSRIVLDNSNSVKQTKVTTVDIAEYINEPIDLIKMDIEGAEFEVIPHLGNKLTLVKAMVIECHITNDQIGNLAKLLADLADAKFKVAVNSYGAWRDLVHRPNKLPDEFDQYMVVAAWR
jgi:FkbM family methyltransferase